MSLSISEAVQENTSTMDSYLVHSTQNTYLAILLKSFSQRLLDMAEMAFVYLLSKPWHSTDRKDLFLCDDTLNYDTRHILFRSRMKTLIDRINLTPWQSFGQYWQTIYENCLMPSGPYTSTFDLQFEAIATLIY
jgi:hypothetical protein